MAFRKLADNETLVRWMLNHGADPSREEAPPAHHTPFDGPAYAHSGASLNAAASSGSLEVFNLVIEHGANLENSVAVHRAAASWNEGSERLPIMARILELGTDVNGLDELEGPYGCGTALHHATICNMNARAKFWLANGADPLTHSRMGVSSFQEAKDRGR